MLTQKYESVAWHIIRNAKKVERDTYGHIVIVLLLIKSNNGIDIIPTNNTVY